jgi:hypothetical protein
MRKVREVLPLHFECACKRRPIAAVCGVSPAIICDEQAGLGWEQARPLSDAEVEARLFKPLGRNEPAARAAIDFAWIHGELRRLGVALQLSGASTRPPHRRQAFTGKPVLRALRGGAISGA